MTTLINDAAEEFEENGLGDVAEYLRSHGVKLTITYLDGLINDAKRDDDPEGWRLGNLEVARDRLNAERPSEVTRFTVMDFTNEDNRIAAVSAAADMPMSGLVDEEIGGIYIYAAYEHGEGMDAERIAELLNAGLCAPNAQGETADSQGVPTEYALSFEPEAVIDHFDGQDEQELLRQVYAAQPTEFSALCRGVADSDDLWQAFHDACRGIVEEVERWDDEKAWGVTNDTPDKRWTWTRQNAPGTMTLAEAKAEAERLNSTRPFMVVGLYEDNHQKYATAINATNADEAIEAAQQQVRDDNASEDVKLIIAAVIDLDTVEVVA